MLLLLMMCNLNRLGVKDGGLLGAAPSNNMHLASGWNNDVDAASF